jgi:hypothetical protein
MNIQLPEDFSISYNRQYNKRALENEISELQSLMTAYERYNALFSASELNTQEEYATADQADARARELGGSGFHTHAGPDGTTVYMPFPSHELMEQALRRLFSDDEPSELKEDMRDKIRRRLEELLDGTTTNSSL